MRQPSVYGRAFPFTLRPGSVLRVAVAAVVDSCCVCKAVLRRQYFIVTRVLEPGKRAAHFRICSVLCALKWFGNFTLYQGRRGLSAILKALPPVK